MTAILKLSIIPVLAVSAASIPGGRQGAMEWYRSTPLRFERDAQTDGFIAGPAYSFRLSARGGAMMFQPASKAAMRMAVDGADPNAPGTPMETLPGTASFFMGNRPEAWRAGVSSYRKIRYARIYRGIDLIYYGNQRQLEYDFVVSPGGDPRQIGLNFSGTRELRIDAEGNLVIASAAGTLVQHRPRVYQETASGRREIAASYTLSGRHRAGFRVGPYDRSRELVIDPVLTYATYAGGGKTDSAYNVAVDGAGNIYISGPTDSTNLPVPRTAPQGTNAGKGDLFVMKFDSKGAAVWSTYLGGSGTELAGGIGVDASGNVFVAGTTDSTNMPVTTGAFQTYNRGGYVGTDGFIAKLDPTGTKLLYCTYLGGNEDEILYAIAVDATGNAYVTGTTASSYFPQVTSPIQSAAHGANVFVTKIRPDGGALVYSNVIGGEDLDLAEAIAVDSSGSAYVTGSTTSTQFPTTRGAYQTTNRGGKTDVFLFKLAPAGNSLVYSTFLGGTADEVAYSVAVDGAGIAYICGRTASLDFPTTAGVLQTGLSGSTDAFVAKVNATGSNLVYSTLLGGSRMETATGIAVDSAGNAYVAGHSTSSNLPMVAPYQTDNGGGSDAFVVKLDAAGKTIVQSTYFGGRGDESVMGMAMDAAGNVYIAGDTDSPDLPVTTGAYQPKYAGDNADAYIARINFSADAVTLIISPDKMVFQGAANGTIARQSVAIGNAAGGKPAWTADVSAAWLSVNPKSGAGTATLDVSVSTAGLAAGTYSGTITITNQVSGTKTAIAVTLTLTEPTAQVSTAGVVNAASYQAGAIAPGEIVVLFGSRMGPDTLAGGSVTPDGALAASIGEARVLFDGTPAPLLYASAGQSSAIVPYAVAGKTSTQVQVEYKGVKSPAVAVPVAPCAPAIFTADSSGKGQASVANQDYTFNSAANPAEKGSIIMFYATGEGQTDPAGTDGKLAGTVFPKPVLPVGVRIGGQPADVLYYGAAPGAVAGVLQVNAKVPESVASGPQPVVLMVGSCVSPAGLTVAVK